MAFTFETQFGDPGYNVNFAVGDKAVNRRDDVMLVQWMLHRIYKGYGWPSVGGKPMAIDGWIGPHTVKWIWDFQRRRRAKGNSCAYDGRVDSARKYTGSVSKTVYTILWMNTYLRLACRDFADNPASDQECPILLRNALANNTDAAGPYQEASASYPATAGI